MAHPNFSAEAQAAFQDSFGERFSVAAAIREQHGRDESRETAVLPDAVVFVQSEQDVVTALQLASQWGLPVVPWSAGSSLEGQLPYRAASRWMAAG